MAYMYMLHELHNRRYNFAVIIQNFKTHKLLISCMSNRGLHPSRCMYHPTAYLVLVQFVLKTRVLRNIFVCVCVCFQLEFQNGQSI